MEEGEEIPGGVKMSNWISTQDHESKADDGRTAVSRNTHETSSATTRLRSCVVIGSTTLAIFCTEQLRARGHKVSSVVATDDVFGIWAAREGIDKVDSLATLEAELAEHPVDWLFSVINPVILSASLIERVREGAFNYHNSPLPRYAGTHATSWALLARETQYAVTWHTITAAVDAGQIAIQQPVSIEPHDTALSLNLKCYQAAQESFSEMLVQLMKGTLLMSSQDSSQRSFYRRTRRPEAGAYLAWSQPAEVLSAMVRALHFGKQYPNPLTCPKLALKSGTVQVNQLQHLEHRSGADPGTLISIGPKGWCVSTSSNDVWISDLATLEGNPVDPEALAYEFGLKPGKQLPNLTVEQAQKIRRMLETLVPYETFWINRLALMQPIQLPYETIPKQNTPQWITSAWYEHIPYCGARNPRWTILAAFAIYLGRLTGQSRFQIGWSLVSVTDQSSLPTILASTVPMECEIDWDSPFVDIVERIEAEIRLLDQNRSYPRDLICRDPALRAISELKSAKPWRIAVSMVDNPVHEKPIGALLTLQIDSHGRFRWIHDAQRLETNVISRMSDHLRELVRAAATNSNMGVAQLNLLSAAEHELLLKTWNDTQTRYPDNACIHQLFEQQVECTPNATAIVFQDEQLSYAQLNERANRLAYRLIELAVAPGDYVATLLERSTELVIAQLAILKAGGIYVPLDFHHALDATAPSHRHEWILNDCSARLIITYVQDTTFNIPVLQLKKVDLEGIVPPNPHTSGSSLDIAYVMYTSGSTGTPKGVLVPHRGVVRLVVNNSFVTTGPKDRVAFAANPAFDASTFEIWAPLLNGGTVVIIDRETVLDSHIFCRTLQKERVNILYLTAGLFNQFAVALADVFPQLDALIVGGDTLDPRAIKAVLSSKPPKRLINGYGPTESTTIATTYTIGEMAEEHGSIPIGRPISNTRIYLMDAYGQPLPLGAVGELCIGGDGVARGYLNRPDLTSERFLPDPFANDPNARVYKTGDLARYLPDGNLLFIGRNDRQFKIRGFRIEPGEIEARLAEHPTVREAVVVAVGEAEKRLIAYVVADEIEPVALREHLRDHLPDYMLPSAFIRLDKFPLTHNGKLDRHALPTPNANALAHVTYEAPDGPIETTLATIWCELLGVEQVGRHDSFFALGGHSLLAVKMIHRATSYGFSCPLNELFEHPQLADLATRMIPTSLTKDHTRAIPVRLAGLEQPLFFVPSGIGDYSYVFSLTRHIEKKYPVYALPWPSSSESFPSSIEALTARMMTFIKAIQPEGPYRIAGYSAGGILAYAIAQSLFCNNDTVAFVGLIDAPPPDLLRYVSTEHIFFRYLAHITTAENFKNVVALIEKIDKIDSNNLVCYTQQILGTEHSPKFLDLGWKRIETFMQAASFYEPLSLPITVHQFQASEQDSTRVWVDADGKNISQNEITNGWKMTLPHTPICFVPIPGNHRTMMTDIQNRSHLGEALSQALETCSVNSKILLPIPRKDTFPIR